MKRAIAIFLVFLYTVSVSGMVMVKHYCNDELMETGLMEVDDCCAAEQDSDSCKDDCCIEKSEVVKIDVPHEKTDVTYLLKIDAPVILSFVAPAISSDALNSFTESAGISFYPPPKISKRVMFSVFRL